MSAADKRDAAGSVDRLAIRGAPAAIRLGDKTDTTSASHRSYGDLVFPQCRHRFGTADIRLPEAAHEVALCHGRARAVTGQRSPTG